MGKTRLEAFSDGVLAIIITIMVLDLKIPHGGDFGDLRDLLPVFFSYVLSFIYIGIYWNNHHHMFHAVTKVNGAVLWANLHLLFWLSLFPFATGWMGENSFAEGPVVIYGGVLMMAAIAFSILACVLRGSEGGSLLARAYGRDYKGKISIVLYAAGIALSFISPWLGVILYAAVACLWIVPDRRVENVLE